LDKRKNNGGHSTKPTKPTDKRLLSKSQAIALVDQMDSIMTISEVLLKLKELADAGDFQALRLLMAYRLGQPKQSIDHTTQGEKIIDNEIDYSKLSDAALREISAARRGGSS
jgi:hypothetical protein